ncbi:MAG: hypothetical protein KDC38_01735 [Planctomycetes bacterium]|nr:hypothetical protein [Planctomycetota bacterium]
MAGDAGATEPNAVPFEEDRGRPVDGANSPSGGQPSDEPTLDERVDAFLAAEGREKRELFKQLCDRHPPAGFSDEILERIAVAVADRSPKLSARVTAILARHGREDLLEANLVGSKPGKAAILRAKYRNVARA